MHENEAIAQSVVDILIEDGVISKMVGQQFIELFQDAVQEQFVEFLVDEGFVEKMDLLHALSQYYNVPWFDAEGYFFDHALINKFPKGFLLRNNCIPIQIDQNILLIAASNPSDPDLLSKLGEYVSYDIRFNVGFKRHINNAVKEFADESLTQTHEDEYMREEKNEVQEKLIEEKGESLDDE